MPEEISIGVVIPALNAEKTICTTIDSVLKFSGEFDIEILIVDGGSTDKTVYLAKTYGIKVLTSKPNRGQQLALGASMVPGNWIFFLHSDTTLLDDWNSGVTEFLDSFEAKSSAGYFLLKFDDESSKAKRLEKFVKWRSKLFGLPYGDQGLLISRSLYEKIGGFRPMLIMEDVDIIRRLKKRRTKRINAHLETSAIRFKRNGYLFRSIRNLFCLVLYYTGVPPKFIRIIYG